MKKLPVIIVAIFFLVIAVGCGSEVRSRLNRAEAIMETSPDTALLILDSIDTGSLNRSSDRALYALLNTQARIKTYEPLTDDSLISGAVSYFTDHGPDSNLMKALFYQAEIRKNDLQYAKAIIPAMRSRELAIKFRNPYWRAKASELISDIYNATYYDQEALKYNMEAINNYKQADKIANHRFSLCDRAILLNRNNKTTQALNLIDSIYSVASQDNEIDSVLLWQCLDYKYSICMLSHLLEKADSTYALLLEIGDESELPMQEIAWKVEIEISKNNLDYFDSIYSQSLPLHTLQDSLAYIITAIKYYEIKGDLEKSLILKDSLLTIQNREVTDVLEQSVIAKQRDFYDLKVEEEKQENENLIRFIVIVVVLCVIISIMIYMNHRHKMRIKAMELDKRIRDIIILSEKLYEKTNEVGKLNSEIDRKDDDIEKLRVLLKCHGENANKLILSQKKELKSQIEILFKEKWELLNRLCSQYVKEEFSGEGKKEALLKEIDKELSELKNSDRLLEIRRCVNLYMNGILVDLENQCGFLKQDDISFIALLYAGFSPKTICLITGIKYKYFYNKRSRLIERIRKSDAESKAVFISKIPMNYTR